MDRPIDDVDRTLRLYSEQYFDEYVAALMVRALNERQQYRYLAGHYKRKWGQAVSAGALLLLITVIAVTLAAGALFALFV